MDPDKNFTRVCTSRTQISRVKIFAPWAKRAQNGGDKCGCGCFVTGTMNSVFFLTGQIGMKFGKKRQSVPLLNLNRRILESFPWEG